MMYDSVDAPAEPPKLRSATTRALKWNYAGAAAKFVSQLAIGVVLARLLGPAPFGLIAAAWLVIGLGNLFADFGFGSALVQRQEISDEDIRSVFSLQVAAGLFLAASVAILAGPMAALLSEPQIATVLRVFSLLFVTQSLGVTSASLLKRKLDFRRLQTAQVASYLSGYLLLGIPLAFSGAGVWSLVTAQLAQSLLFSAAVYWSVRHPVRPLFSIQGRDIRRFGATVFATNLTNYTISNLDSAFIARVFGMVSLGLYNRSGTLLSSIVNNVVVVLQGVLFPAYSRAQTREPDVLKRVYLASMGTVSLLMLPLGLCIAAAAPAVVYALYGSDWSAAVPLLYPLALAMPFHALMALNGPVIWGTGQVARELRAQLIVGILFAIVLSFCASLSVVAVAWAVAGISVVRFFMMALPALRVVGGSWMELFRTLCPSFLCALPAGGVVMTMERFLSPVGAPPGVRLAIEIPLAAVTLMTLISLLPVRWFGEDLGGIVLRLSSFVGRRTKCTAPYPC